MQYIRERTDATLVGSMAYSDRRTNGENLVSGYQFGLQGYLKTGERGSTHISAKYSRAVLFPKLLMGGSYFHYFASGWDADLGMRYIRTAIDSDIYALAAGGGTYVCDSWIHLKTFLFFDHGQHYTALNGTWRYYFNGKYDYWAFMAGYGTAPDESPNIIQFDERASLDSYRLGIGYSRSFGKRIIGRVQTSYNYQEYVPGRTQNQVDFFFNLRYSL